MDGESSLEKIAKVVTCAWAMWGNRNEIRMGGQRKAGRVLLQWTTQYLEEYYAATDTNPDTSSPCVQVISWSPPQGSTYKVNVNRAMFPDLKEVVIGVVIRDDKGRVMEALSKKVHAPLGTVEAEAKAFEKRLQGKLLNILEVA